MVANNILSNPLKGASMGFHYAKAQMQSDASKIMAQRRINFVSAKMENNDLYVYLHLISSKSPKIVYDIIFQFLEVTKTVNNDKQINGVFKDSTQFKVFTNRPDFCFAHAYVFNQLNLIIPKYKTLLSGRILVDPPKVKNPTKSIDIVPTLFFGLHYLDTMDLFGQLNYLKLLNNVIVNPKSFSYIMAQHNTINKQTKQHNQTKKKKVIKKK